MRRSWLICLVALWSLAAPNVFAQTAKTGSDNDVLCGQLHRVEQAALGNFVTMRGGSRQYLFTLPKDAEVDNPLGPRLYGSKLILPEAEDCYVRPSSLRGKNSYYCFWNSERPQFAAADYIRKISQCFDNIAPRQSDFNEDLMVTTAAHVSFVVAADRKGGRYKVRLSVDGVEP